jgi:hypothetical protein
MMRTTIVRRPGMGWRRVLVVVAAVCVAAATTAAPVVPNAAGYVWDSVAIGGGGFVTAIVPSRSEPGVAYARSDVGGACLRRAKEGRWTPLLDWVGQDQTGLLGIDALAIDPDNAADIWLLAGIAYLNGGRTAILRSTDYGKTFDVVDVSARFKTHGNGFGRQGGERPVVDPGAAKRLHLGSRRDSQSADGGRSWQRNPALPVAVADPVNPKVFYAADDKALVASSDGAASFAPLAGVAYGGAVGFGKAAPGKLEPTLYIRGSVNGVRGVHRSLGPGRSWRRINDDDHQYGGHGGGHFIVGDMNRYGVVYMSTAGRGIVYERPGPT